ncbi:MAG TPA: hypothetical protein VG318_12375 [Actinomycetota bacterium]|nr:hypothetical protein [Actinomycetota bacterium]
MRPKLALLVAVAVVFAPGWPASHDGGVATAGEALAGRILAPTVEEADVASGKTTVQDKRLERANPRSGSSNAIGWRSAASPPRPSASWGSLPSLPVAGAAARAPSAMSTRAPPHELPV